MKIIQVVALAFLLVQGTLTSPLPKPEPFLLSALVSATTSILNTIIDSATALTTDIANTFAATITNLASLTSSVISPILGSNAGNIVTSSAALIAKLANTAVATTTGVVDNLADKTLTLANSVAQNIDKTINKAVTLGNAVVGGIITKALDSMNILVSGLLNQLASVTTNIQNAKNTFSGAVQKIETDLADSINKYKSKIAIFSLDLFLGSAVTHTKTALTNFGNAVNSRLGDLNTNVSGTLDNFAIYVNQTSTTAALVGAEITSNITKYLVNAANSSTTPTTADRQSCLDSVQSNIGFIQEQYMSSVKSCIDPQAATVNQVVTSATSSLSGISTITNGFVNDANACTSSITILSWITAKNNAATCLNNLLNTLGSKQDNIFTQANTIQDNVTKDINSAKSSLDTCIADVINGIPDLVSFLKTSIDSCYA